MRKKFKIYFVPYGIANRMSNKIIEINEKLLQTEYEPLLYEIVEHEMKHTDRGYSIKDFELDSKGFKHKWLYWKFILTHPSSWIQFSPLYPSRGKIYIDFSVLWFWGFAGIIFGAIFLWILTKLF